AAFDEPPPFRAPRQVEPLGAAIEFPIFHGPPRTIEKADRAIGVVDEIERLVLVVSRRLEPFQGDCFQLLSSCRVHSTLPVFEVAPRGALSRRLCCGKKTGFRIWRYEGRAMNVIRQIAAADAGPHRDFLGVSRSLCGRRWVDRLDGNGA